MLKIGLTGGIGSGKSTVCKLFSEYSVPIIDADAIARQIVAPGQPALVQIARQFPDAMLDDGQLDRQKLGQIVFANAEKKQQLEAILHPLIYQKIQQNIDSIQSSAPYCILDIPLLLESRWHHLVNRILVIDCPVWQQRQRVRQRSQLSDEQINRIIASQIGRNARLTQADDIIDNSKSMTELAEQVKNLHNLYLSLVQY